MTRPSRLSWSRGVRIARAGARVAAANLGRLRSPLKLNLCVTYWCQYKCKTCNIWKRKPTDELTTDELLLLIKRNPTVAWLDVTGGEIVLRDDMGEILEAIARQWRKLVVLHFPTNGFLTKRIVDVATRVTAQTDAQVIVTVSLDGPADLNDEIRGIQGGYRRQIETFNALRRISGLRVVFGMTLSRFNVGHVEATFQACQRDCPGLTWGDFHVNVAQVSDHYYGSTGEDAFLPPPARAKDALRRYRAVSGMPTSVAAWVERAYLRHLETFLDTGRTPMPCHSLRSSCFVDPWGVVYPCITYSRPIGRLRETGMDLAPIWSAHETASLQAEIWRGQCPNCWTACEAYQSILGNLVR